MSVYIFPPNRPSASAVALANAMHIKRISRNPNSRFVGSPDKVVINWGNSSVTDEVNKCIVINAPAAVADAVDKLKAFQRLEGWCGIPPFTTNEREAMDWVERGNRVVARHRLDGHGGDGIEILRDPIQDFPCKCPLYTMYIPKKYEYRVHVFNGRVVDVQKKMRREDAEDEDVNWEVRNHANGFIYGRKLQQPVPDCVLVDAVLAVTTLHLTFGAVDIIYNEKRRQSYVLEVNTAPGLEGQTVETYARAMLALPSVANAM